MILKTTNGGNNWSYQESGVHTSLNSIFFTSPDTGYIVGGAILKTTNAGNTWSILSNNLNGFSCFFTNSNTGYLVGGYSIFAETIYKTTNGGIDWLTQSSGALLQLNSVFFTNENIGYAVGHNGRIIKTITAGEPTISNSNNNRFNVKIYPNPFNDILTINIAKTSNFELIDLFGNILAKQELFDFDNTFDLKKLKSGTYILKIMTDDFIIQKKIIKL